MRTTYFLTAILSIGLLLGSCIKKGVKPSDDITLETRQHSGYSKIDVSDAMNVYVSMSAQEEVVVEANENLHEYILTDVVNGTLKIRLKNNVRIKSGATINIYVSALQLEDIVISGASRVELENELTTTNFDLDISGASSFQGGVSCVDGDLNVSGASRVELWGDASSFEMDVSGASNVSDFAFLITDYLEIDLSGASKAELTVDGTMNIEASGASTFNYKGNGLIDELDISGASSVNKK